MKHFSILCMVTLIASRCLADQATTRPVELFNGKDLDGWTWVQRPPTTRDSSPITTIENIWSVADGVLHDKGKPIGFIRTATQFHDFILTVEQRHLDKGNGGILFAMTGPDKVWPHCLECQGQVGSEGDIRGIANFKITADPERTEKQRVRRIGNPEFPVGQWETVVVKVDHGHITITINSQLANEATTSDDLSGCIGLQAEGGAMEFRKIELVPINP